MMEITFQDAIQKAKQKDQKLSLLLGNGFSMDFDRQIFSQEKLIQSALAQNLFKNEKLLSQILGREKIENFEVLMQSIRDFCSLPKEIEKEKTKVYKIIMKALSHSHPASSSQIAETESTQCANFLRNFKVIYTLNYDLLLYWVIMKEDLNYEFKDGFINSTWSNYKCTNMYYLHGGLHLYKAPNNRIAKYCYSNGNNLRSQIIAALKESKLPITVSGGTSQEKLQVIEQCNYLVHCLESLENAEGILFIHGFNFNPNDEHIMDAIADSQIEKLFISIHSSNNLKNIRNAIEKIQKARNLPDKKPLEVTYYKATTAQIWRSSNPIIEEEQSIAEGVVIP